MNATLPTSSSPSSTELSALAEELQHHSSQISFADSGGYFSHRYRRFGS